MTTTDHPPSDEPAFPREDYQADNAPGQRGMSLRDYFAAKAMQALAHDAKRTPYDNTRTLAELAYAMADAMLAARANP